MKPDMAWFLAKIRLLGKRLACIRIFKGTRETLRQLLLFLATLQGTAGIGLISIVTVLGKADAPVSLGEPHALVP